MLKRGQFVHCVHDAVNKNYVLVDLETRRQLPIEAAKYACFARVLGSPNEVEHFSSEEQAIRHFLEKLSFLVPEEKDELAELEQRYWLEKRCPENLALGIVLTQKCNFRCVYCNQEHFGSALSSEDVDRIAAFVGGEAPRLRQFYVTWWGGEPLLKLDTIEELTHRFEEVCKLHAINYRAFTSTNASLITRDVAARLSRLHFEQFQISVDGPRKIHDIQRPMANKAGTYDLVIQGLRNLVSEFHSDRRFITLRVHATALANAELSDWYQFLTDLDDCKHNLKLHFIPAHDSFRFDVSNTVTFKEMVSRLDNVIGEARTRGFYLAESALLDRDTLMHCGAVSDRSWFVLPGSRLTRCNNAFNDPKDDCGRLEPDGRISLLPKASEWIDHSPFKFDECRSCDVLPICMGGCRIIDFTHVSGTRCQIKQSVRDAILEKARHYENVQ